MEAMGQLTGGVAHDFNNLLTPIVGALDLLQRRGVGGEREQRLISGAVQSADRATDPRPTASGLRAPPTPSSRPPWTSPSLCLNMADLIASTSGPPDQGFPLMRPKIFPSPEPTKNQLEMALLNLSVNARDAMARGGTLRISATKGEVRAGDAIGSSRLARYVKLSVADTGSGMDEATLARAGRALFLDKGRREGNRPWPVDGPRTGVPAWRRLEDSEPPGRWNQCRALASDQRRSAGHDDHARQSHAAGDNLGRRRAAGR